MTQPLRHVRDVILAGLVIALGLYSWNVTAQDKVPERRYAVPSLGEIVRIDKEGGGWPDSKARRQELRKQSLYAFQVEAHPVRGRNYVIVTDHKDQKYLQALKRLQDFRKGQILQFENFSQLCENPEQRQRLLTDLRKAEPRFIAIAPRRDHFRENVVLAFLDVIAAMDADPELDAFPAWLVAPDEESFQQLIEQSITYQSSLLREIKPFTLCQVSARETRSQQKASILDDYFDTLNITMPSLSVRIRAPGITREMRSAVGDVDDLVIGTKGGGNPLAQIPERSAAAMGLSSLIMVFGHGTPGRICGMSLTSFEPVDLSGKVVLSGACFSAQPLQSDFPMLKKGPDGEVVVNSREKFVDRFVGEGAVAVLAHMRLSDGFPSVLPVFESMVKGMSLGESMQRLLNAAIRRTGLHRGRFCLVEEDKQNQQALLRRNALLWVMIGDPALQVVHTAK